MKKKCKNPDVPHCQFCKNPLIRVFNNDDGKMEIRCNHCNERLDRKVDSHSGRSYVKCPYCGYEGEELISPNRETKCPRCNKFVLQTHVNLK